MPCVMYIQTEMKVPSDPPNTAVVQIRYMVRGKRRKGQSGFTVHGSGSSASIGTHKHIKALSRKNYEKHKIYQKTNLVARGSCVSLCYLQISKLRAPPVAGKGESARVAVSWMDG